MKKLFTMAAVLFVIGLSSCADEAAEVTPNSSGIEVASDEVDTNGTGNTPPRKPGSTTTGG